MLLEPEIGKYPTYIGRETFYVRLEICGHIVCIVAKLLEGESRDIVELVTGNLIHTLRRIIWIFLILCNNGVLGLFQGTFKPSEYCHRYDDVAVMVRHIGSTELIGNTPNKVGFACDVYGIVIPKEVW